MVEEQKRYFEEMGMNVKYETDPYFGHWFRDWQVAGDISRHCYNNLGVQYPDLPYDSKSLDFVEKGYFSKFDQFQLANDLGIDTDVFGMWRWGFYYYPEACIDKSCNVQILLHGCLMEAELFA